MKRLSGSHKISSKRVKLMHEYEVTDGAVNFGPGQTILLTDDQFKVRSHNVEVIESFDFGPKRNAETGRLCRTVNGIQFKVGEMLCLDGDLPKIFEDRMTVVEGRQSPMLKQWVAIKKQRAREVATAAAAAKLAAEEEAKAAELEAKRQAGSKGKLESADTLVGSSVLPESVQIGEGLHSQTVTLGDVVNGAFEESKLSFADWNALEDDDREGRLAAYVDGLKSPGFGEAGGASNG